MSPWESLVQNVFVWLAVYPAVLVVSYGFQYFEIDLPLYVEILISTALTVPLISYVAVPAIEKRMAAAQGESQADLKHRQAEDAEH